MIMISINKLLVITLFSWCFILDSSLSISVLYSENIKSIDNIHIYIYIYIYIYKLSIKVSLLYYKYLSQNTADPKLISLHPKQCALKMTHFTHVCQYDVTPTCISFNMIWHWYIFQYDVTLTCISVKCDVIENRLSPKKYCYC